MLTDAVVVKYPKLIVIGGGGMGVSTVAIDD